MSGKVRECLRLAIRAYRLARLHYRLNETEAFGQIDVKIVDRDASRAYFACCYDCGLPYSDPGFADLVVPHAIWNKHLSPLGHEGGLLCPTCMVRRATVAELENVPARFTSGPFSLSQDGGQ